MESNWDRALLRNVEVLMPLQRFNEYGEKGDEAFGADAVGGIPGQEERVLDLKNPLTRIDKLS
jgi:hypothetical protein